MSDTMPDLNRDPYAGIETEEERQAIYELLLTQYERDLREHERKRKIYDDFSSVWDTQREIQIEADIRFHKNILAIASGSFAFTKLIKAFPAFSYSIKNVAHCKACCTGFYPFNGFQWGFFLF